MPAAHPRYAGKSDEQEVLIGLYLQPILNPKGDLEGLLIEVGGAPAQIVIDPNEEAEFFDGISVGQSLKVKAAPVAPSPKGEPVHPVFRFHALQAVDGKKPNGGKKTGVFKGKVLRLNFAKHGLPNGVILDTGDFIHLRPRGFIDAGLNIGDSVKASGRAKKMAKGGFVVEAAEVNGVAIEAHK
ncbi:MAG: hypothetical protein JWQ90_4825 [Hydrocarboniphaga sp.]|uniref:hypothetical protein n=1 Tax=Hydrocarboniphaga sp. TaxID=2033016 RepID=UPI00262D60FD|nr:hypothetical protein [Hydrocarboniphaga sp.]MDB5972375.1 hypothetical protein [Hydrocarboniphaga sp.]